MSDFPYTAQGTAHSTHSAKKIEKGLKRLLVIAAIIFGAELVWLFGISPFIPFSTVEVQTFDGFNRDSILRLAGVTETSSFVSVNINEIQEKLLSNVLVESSKVIKRFPDKLSIYLSPREAAALSLTVINGEQKLLYVDRKGVFFKTAEYNAIPENLVVLSGIDNPQLNMQLPAALVPLMENISAIAGSAPELLAAISEIRIEPKAWEGYELVIFPVHSTIRVRVESNLTEDVLKYMLLLLNVLEESNPKPLEVDFRSGIGSYRNQGSYLW